MESLEKNDRVSEAEAEYSFFVGFRGWKILRG